MPTTVYHDFVLVADDVESGPGGDVSRFRVQVFDSPVGQGERYETVSIPSDLPPHLDDWNARRLDTNPVAQIALGQKLAGLILPPIAWRMFISALDNLPSGEGLRLRLRLDDRLAVYPWEFSHLPEAHGENTPSSFLALDTRLSIRRDPALPFPPDLPGPTPPRRRVLIAYAAPIDLPPLPNLEAERRMLRSALAEVPALELVSVPDAEKPVAPGASLPDLAAALALANTDIFHYSGHGVFRESPGAPGVGMIALTGSDGKAAGLPADRLCELLRSHGVRLVVLSACHTAQRDARGVWNSLAAAMLKARIPAVVAMQALIRDDLAAAFGAALHRALIAGFTLDYAVAAGRMAARAASADGVDWAVPVLYARGELETIFSAVTDSAAQQQAERELQEIAPVQINQQIGQVFGPVIGEFRGDIGNISVSNGSPFGDLAPRQLNDSTACASCGHDLPPKARFCPNCGAETGRPAEEPQSRFCAQCGAELGSQARFCPNCGHPAA